MNPLERLEFDAAALVAQHPPRWGHPHKQLIHDLVYPPRQPPTGHIVYSRWAAMGLPETRAWPAPGCAVEGRPDFFDYWPVTSAPAVEWHPNFADPHLFVAYGSSLFAQDEMQVMEHPALGSLREALVAGGHVCLSVERSQPTPILITGVERRVAVATDVNAAAGRPDGLYANAFADADTAAIRAAITPVEPPTRSNILAMSAPRPDHGPYRREQILEALVASYTGFRATWEESCRLAGPQAAVVVHTGYWGCGAFGGNRQLMALLQALAASLAGLDRLVFHAGNVAGVATLESALTLLARITARRPQPTAEVIEAILQQRFQWGVSDGN